MQDVLIVEDEDNILKLVSVNLFSRGYQVSEAKSASEALAQLYQKPPAMMILDIKLPDFSGWELLNRMAHDPKLKAEIPVLIMTASITDAYGDIQSNPSVVGVLIKPFSSLQLISAVHNALEK